MRWGFQNKTLPKPVHNQWQHAMPNKRLELWHTTLKRSYKWSPTHFVPVQKVNIALTKLLVHKKFKAFSRL